MKIDFHIHTIKNEFLDPPTNFDLSTLLDYVKENNFSAIAITNHNLFNKNQFLEILDGLKDIDCVAFPGIEVSLEGGHILVIGDSNEKTYDSLTELSDFLKSQEWDDHYKMSINDFEKMVCRDDYLLIPHYLKDPQIPKNILEKLNDTIFVGEAQCAKKFYSIQKEGRLTPVYFSDIRITKCENDKENAKNYQKVSRYTYLRCESKSFKAIKEALRNNKSTSLTSNFENDFFEIMNGESLASTGINVLLGKRSSGKTFTLDHVCGQESKNALYIRQFDIVKKCDEDKFDDFLKRDNDETITKYLKELNSVLDFINELPAFEIEKELKNYLESLVQSANQNLEDAYSKVPLFQNRQLDEKDNKAISLYQAFDTLLSAQESYSKIIFNKISKREILSLYFNFVNEAKMVDLKNTLIEKANNIGAYVGQKLESNSTKIRIKKIDFKKTFKYRYAKTKFDNLINNYKDRIICSRPLFGKFVTEVVLKRQKDKKKLKSQLKAGTKVNIDYLIKDSPYDAYFKAKNDNQLTFDDARFKLFFSIDKKVRTMDGFELSGGQKAEFILLSTLENYRTYDMILIDEMESSFDNPFLNKEIVSKIREMAKNSTVFISTHNNNLGVSLNPDFYIYHKLEVDKTKKELIHKKYYGLSSSETLKDKDGSTIPLSEVLVSTMEADKKAYNERRHKYENS